MPEPIKYVQIMMPESEHAVLHRAVELSGQRRISDWAREILLPAALGVITEAGTKPSANRPAPSRLRAE